MHPDLLEQAATQAKTKWLEQELREMLPQVWDLTPQAPGWPEAAAAWATQIDQMFEYKKLLTPNQQKNRRTDIANALRTIAPQHPLIPFVLLPAEVYTQINNEQAKLLSARSSKFFSRQQADELVQRAIALLDQEEPNSVAAALALLVGRRIGEILISQFKPKTAFSLLFSEGLKRRQEQGLEFEIPTLTEAEPLLARIQWLQQVWKIEDLKSLDLAPNHLKRQINVRYSGVPHACRQHFAKLLPGREAETDLGERLYTHLLRAAYTEIATYYYKPLGVPDHRFKAQVQGHFKLSQDGQMIPNYAARQSYDDYLICDRTPGEPGVKLGTPGVEILEVFQQEVKRDMEEQVSEAVTLGDRRLLAATINALLYRTVDRLLFSHQWAEAAAGLVLVTGRKVETLLSAALEQKTQFSILVDEMEVPTLTGASQIVAAWKKFTQTPPLPGPEIETALEAVCTATFKNLVPVQSVADLRAIYSAIALHWFCPPEVAPEAFLPAIGAAETAGFATAKGDRGIKLGQRGIEVMTSLQTLGVVEAVEAQETGEDLLTSEVVPLPEDPEPRVKPRQRCKDVAVDTDLLKKVAAQYNIEIRSKKKSGGLSYEAALAQLLTLLSQDLPAGGRTPAHPVEGEWTIALTEQAKTLTWLTGRIELLEQQTQVLKQERDQAITQLEQADQSPELKRLQRENNQLQQERDQAMNKLQAFRQLLEGIGLEETPTDEKSSSQQEAQLTASSPLTVVGKSDQSKSTRRRSLERDETLEHIRAAVRAIMDFNDQEGRTFNDKWYVSYPVVQTLLRLNGFSASQNNVAAVFEELKEEMDDHHDKHQLGSRHNRRHPMIEIIQDKVKLESDK